LTVAVLILSTDGRPSAELHPRGQLTVSKSALFGGQNVWLSELQVSVFLAVWQGAPSCYSDH